MAKEEKKSQRLLFDADGKFIGVNGHEFKEEIKKEINSKKDYYSNKRYLSRGKNIKLKTSDSLEFLKEDTYSNEIKDISSKNYWDLNENGKPITPLKFSNGKTQEDVVKEITDLIKNGTKIIFLHGTCGSGKSAIALNVARVLGKSSIVVPFKALQKQYEDDYLEKKYLLKPSGEKMKIAMITGKNNHDSIISPGISCADPLLPENIKITEKNYGKLLEYLNDYEKEAPNIEDIRRLDIAVANPYWSPLLPADFDIPKFKDVKKYKYKGINNRDFIFYHRKYGCSYYDQYLSYIKSDIIIYNSAKFKSELSLGRKPETVVDIIDEADEFLDNLFQQEELNISKLIASLKFLNPEKISTKEEIKKIIELLELEEKNKRILGIDESDVFYINDTKIENILRLFTKNIELESEIILDELNYANKALEISRNLEGSFEDIYLTYKKDEENLIVNLVSTNLSAKFKDLLNKSNALIFMSGTLHSEKIIKEIFEIKDYKFVEAETLQFGSIEIIRTGKEIDCKYSNFSEKVHTRKDYLNSLSESMNKTKHPTLIHVHSFQDLPTEKEKNDLNLFNLMSSDKLKEIQEEDRIGRTVAVFKSGLADTLFSTKCSRGADFPGEMCNSIIFTKYPNPNVSDTFWKILKKTHPNQYWDFYKDKANREFLQRIYRALRSVNDHVYILSPDIRVINAVRELQEQALKK